MDAMCNMAFQAKVFRTTEGLTTGYPQNVPHLSLSNEPSGPNYCSKYQQIVLGSLIIDGEVTPILRCE